MVHAETKHSTMNRPRTTGRLVGIAARRPALTERRRGSLLRKWMIECHTRSLDRPGPKRILSLDAGGIRGALTLGILAQLEATLRARHQHRIWC